MAERARKTSGTSGLGLPIYETGPSGLPRLASVGFRHEAPKIIDKIIDLTEDASMIEIIDDLDSDSTPEDFPVDSQKGAKVINLRHLLNLALEIFGLRLENRRQRCLNLLNLSK